ncbi:hypothetical protein WJ85_15205 [Burkholderia ubonensis]|uniref:hypothetical protein n=1 Tax=Burkholderia ubonensis TaxID=101571 RepID=UPI00075D1A40|nr:hypothetical protein [Burkholderia ubonensis]KVP13601.1 hypothetical protein WJ85_15205 [Burkholderia ubonensis]KVZ68328.1 hypothetical protein WL19_20860 [Burkholderia ubonensis]KVZ87671.1 hypothetical protein WL24_00870 [Burkholderia ubonensis]KWC00057.1 hypothetical protein WL44_01265 [Burkholderia ubonensis]OJA31017.1 hypothetical protein BGV47_24585 [Burkholderia ubonensis]
MNTVKLTMVDSKTVTQGAKPRSAHAGPMKSDVFKREQSSRAGTTGCVADGRWVVRFHITD